MSGILLRKRNLHPAVKQQRTCFLLVVVLDFNSKGILKSDMID